MAIRKKRKMTTGEARQMFDNMYSRDERKREAAAEAFLRTPAGELARQKRNAETVRKNPRRKINARNFPYVLQTYTGSKWNDESGCKTYGEAVDGEKELQGEGLKTRIIRCEYKKRVTELKKNPRRAKRKITRVRRNPSFVPHIRKGNSGYWYIEAKHEGGMLLYVQLGSKGVSKPLQSSFVRTKADATHFKSQYNAGEVARKLLPYIDSRIEHLKVVR